MAGKALFIGGCPAPWHRIEPAEGPFKSALEEAGFEVTVTGIRHPDGGDAWTGDYSALTAENLAPYDALVLYTTGNDTHGADVQAIIDFVNQGNALIGVHNAADSFTNNPAYVAMLGAKFRTHPEQLDIALEFTDTEHPITRGLKPFTVKDELYLFTEYDPSRVYLLAQTHSFDDGGPVPLCWTREEGRGRIFYLSLGHNPSTLEDPAWRALFERGVQWATRQLG